MGDALSMGPRSPVRQLSPASAPHIDDDDVVSFCSANSGSEADETQADFLCDVGLDVDEVPLNKSWSRVRQTGWQSRKPIESDIIRLLANVYKHCKQRNRRLIFAFSTAVVLMILASSGVSDRLPEVKV